MKDKQQILGSPEITFCVAGLSMFLNCRSGFDPDWNTFHATTYSKRKLYFMNQEKKAVQEPALSESPLHDYLRVSQHYLQACFQIVCGNGRRELGAAFLTPTLIFFKFSDMFLT